MLTFVGGATIFAVTMFGFVSLWQTLGDGVWFVLLGFAVAISFAIARLSRWLGGE